MAWRFALVATSSCKALSDVPAEAGTDGSHDGIVEGCRGSSDCLPAQYCEFTPGLCGKGKRAGACRERPASCNRRSGTYSPVCGCDGQTFDNECSARAAGVDLAVMGGCKQPIAGYAACGQRYCDVRTSYCEIFLSDVFELPTDHFCRTLPPSCLPSDGKVRTCDCFPSATRCRGFCGPLPTAPGSMSGFHLTCQGTLPPQD